MLEDILNAKHSGIFIVISALIAFIGGWLINSYGRWKDANSLRKNIASAFYGEIIALLNLAKRRKYLGQLKELRKIIASESDLFAVRVPINKNSFKVYDNNIGSIGILKHPLPSKISRFYIMVSMILGDLKSFQTEEFDKLPKDIKLKSIDESIANLKYCIKIGYKIKFDLEKEIKFSKK